MKKKYLPLTFEYTELPKHTPQGVQESFEKMMRETAQVVRRATRKLMEVIEKRGDFNCGEAWKLLKDTKEMVLIAKELFTIAGAIKNDQSRVIFPEENNNKDIDNTQSATKANYRKV